MTSPPELRYLPFWTLYEYIGDTPNRPWISVYIQKTYTRSARGPDGIRQYEAATIAIFKPDSELVAEDIPTDMLIEPDSLTEWAGKIAKWFTDDAIKIANEKLANED